MNITKKIPAFKERYYKTERKKRHEPNTAHSAYLCIAVKLICYKLRYHFNEYQSGSKTARFPYVAFR